MSNGFKNRFDPPEARHSGPPPEPGISGRRFVLAAMAACILGAGVIGALFRSWRQAFQERMILGNREVVAAVEPLAAIVPSDEPAVDARAWKATVEQTQGMLRSVVATNLLDSPALLALGADIRARVATARPDNVRALLSNLWDDITRKAGPSILKRHGKPGLLQPPKNRSLAS